MADYVTCTDCLETQELAICTVCGKPVCGAHRSGTGRLADGYQCKDRDCWAIVGHQVFGALRDKYWPKPPGGGQ